MPYFKISINGKAAATGGGYSIDVLSFGVLRASNTGCLVAQLTGLNKATSEHLSWMHAKLSEHDVVRIDFFEDEIATSPASIWRDENDGPPLILDDALQREGSNHADVEPTKFCSNFRVKLGDGKCVQASANIAANLQLSVTWSKAANACKVEVGANTIEENAQCEVWVESVLDFGQHLEWEAY